jgi:hypothetical protein
MKKIFASLLILFLCTPAHAKEAVSQLELREVQTRVFETPDTNTVFKAAINTLQDNGFIIQNIEEEIGYIWAKKELKAKHTDKRRVAVYSAIVLLSAGCSVINPAMLIYTYDPAMHISNEVAPKTVVVDANINIEPFGAKSTKVRFTMVQKILENADGYSYVKSSPRKVIRIYNPALYIEFFNQLDKNIFYENI